jgi:hypothetical protein
MRVIEFLDKLKEFDIKEMYWGYAITLKERSKPLSKIEGRIIRQNKNSFKISYILHTKEDNWGTEIIDTESLYKIQSFCETLVSELQNSTKEYVSKEDKDE